MLIPTVSLIAQHVTDFFCKFLCMTSFSYLISLHGVAPSGFESYTWGTSTRMRRCKWIVSSL